MQTLFADDCRHLKNLISETAKKLHIHEAIIEKDFWLCQILDYLFNNCTFIYNNISVKECLYFKGGTSLSKMYNIIERFSEDIDLVLDWRVLGYKYEPIQVKGNRRKKLRDDIRQKRDDFIKLLAIELNSVFNSIFPVNLNFNCKDSIIEFIYPRYFALDAIVPEIRLEIGSLSSIVPFETRETKSYISNLNERLSHEFPKVFSNLSNIKVISLKRTFYEKLTILHKEAMKTIPSNGEYHSSRHARHYYDIYKILNLAESIAYEYDKELMAEVISFNNQFYHCVYAKYDEIHTSGLRLIPEEPKLIDCFRIDYEKMLKMIFEKPKPTFDEILEVINNYENEINSLILSS